MQPIVDDNFGMRFTVGDTVSVLVPLYLQTCDRRGEKLQPFAIATILEIDENSNKCRVRFATDDNDESGDWVESNRMHK